MEKLLFEIGTEEIPAKFMPGILKQLQELAAGKMQELRIPFENITVYGTPRRMTFIAAGVAETQADSTIEAKGPSVKIAFVSGAPSKAAIGFARGQGVDVNELEVRGEYVYAVKHLAGQPVADLLPALLLDILESLSFPKNMRWADYDFRFVRPIRWLVALFGDKVVPVEITGVKSGRYSMGHRFMQQSMKEAVENKGLLSAALNKVGNVVHSAVMGMQGAVEIPNADAYVQALADNFVLVDQDARRELIRQQVTELAAAEGGIAEIDEDLLEEVNYLVEYPTALCGKFEEKFLSLPKEAIITPMREHQRYFPVVDAEGRLLNKFITVRNGGKEFLDVVAHGNERVLRARLSDAEFFFNEDRKIKLEDRLEKLKTVSFQEGLGNMYDKSERLTKLAEMVKFAINVKVDDANLKRTALLAKTDLVAGMVVEFTELQGVMGREYAKLDGEPAEVAAGIYEHYLPRFAGDELPQGTIGRIVGISDKLDNIVATFSRGLAPTGSQDPYALRRQALGIINILISSNYHLPLIKILAGALYLLNIKPEDTGKLIPQILEFFKLRLKNLMIEQGIRYDVVDAVFADERNDDLVDIYARCQALNAYVALPEAEAVIQASIRVCNLCKKIDTEVAISSALFADPAEQELHDVLIRLNKELIPDIVTYNYAAALKLAEQVVEPVNKFFDSVMVMDENVAVKNNRLALLEQAKEVTNAVGDLSCIVL
ncbi:MAG: glycine--tRNA ligase subunit beta [Phascolarctobacterium sp.]|uniref:glycine--tRNA ligase subunit beta n=1 Tax=Phascolarctobacterium sp. TaxID=2049039 RepID=UPI0025D62B76|nr:glycine--tRNA ligase subunit beta [Phascolarctobacterium sp.]MCC8158085.1 glycine--tRNA ligase subunit beta [Phascolarctobacterium sp.]